MRFSIDPWFQGPTGSGQGGWAARRFTEHLDARLTVSLAAPVPLDSDLVVVVADDDPTRLLEDATGTVVMTAEPREAIDLNTETVPLDAAAAARRTPNRSDHPVPHCFSCGLGHDSMRVHPGRLADGRVATDWHPPAWAAMSDGTVDEGAVWAALDCTAAWFVADDTPGPLAVTVRLAVDVFEPVRVGETYAVVGWSGGAEGWAGRKRTAASALFDRDGSCVAVSTSMWVRIGR